MEWIAPIVVVVCLLAIWGAIALMQSSMRRVEHKVNVLLRHFNIEPSLGPPLSERVRNLADDPSQKIQAIKAYREETGTGLADAKAAVEAYLDGR